MGTFKKGGEPIKTAKDYQTRLLEVQQSELDRRALTISQLNDRLQYFQEQFTIVDDAATYWKQEFEELYNMLYRAINLTDPEIYSDGQVVDLISDGMKKFAGQSDEQIG